MNTSQTVNGLPAAFNVTSGVTVAGAVNVRNNIFANSQTVGTDRYSIYSGATSAVFAAIDYNDYTSSGPNLGFIGSNRAALSDIVTGIGGNANSFAVDPLFTTATDLHLMTGSPMIDVGVDLSPTVVLDYDGDARPLGGGYGLVRTNISRLLVQARLNSTLRAIQGSRAN